ncbi:uncharacterized protein [Macrobrachium rosenbergii]|uniref:uncharacterized protein n=1 Tax=Macrobrachium rosenbergii TaxID=79674 RepID=UPI0034D47258
MAAEEPRGPEPIGFYVRDTVSGRMMLVDTGAIRSIFPASREDRKQEPDPRDPRCPPSALPPHQYSQLLTEFPDVFRPELCQKSGNPDKHGIYHHIKTKGPPAYAKFRRLPPRRLQEAKDAFAEMERMGICKKASSPWASPLHMVQKPDSSWRPCGDYRRLNLATEPDHYPLLNMQDLTASFHGAKIFTKLDLLKSYFQVLVAPQDIPKTAIITPFGSYVVHKANFLGHEVSPDGVRPLTSKVAAVTRFPVPTSVKAIQGFLGVVNYYRRFIPGIAHTTAPLMETLKGQPKSLLWGPSQQQAFSLTKAAIAEATALAHQDPSTPLQLTTDASNVACGAVLEQEKPCGGRPLQGRAECHVQLGINYEDLAREQAADPDTPAYRTAITSLKWRDVPLTLRGPNLLCDVSTGQPRPLVPASRRRQVFDIIHGLSHPSGRTTAKLLSEKFVQHRVQKDARTWARQCLHCQTSKVGRHTKSGVGEFPQPGRRFSHVHIDVVGPLPPSGGSRYLLTAVDRSTRRPKAKPMQEPTTSACAEALLSSWISRLGVPDQLLGTAHHTTTAYNPATNGLVKRSHRSLKASLMARCTTEDWKYQLPSATFTPPGLASTTHVFVRDDAVRPPLTRPYQVPFRVLERNSKAFLLALHRRNDWVSIDRVKPALLEENTTVNTAQPLPQLDPRKKRKRGRPRKRPPTPTFSHPRTQDVPLLSSRTRGTLQCPGRYAD